MGGLTTQQAGELHPNLTSVYTSQSLTAASPGGNGAYVVEEPGLTLLLPNTATLSVDGHAVVVAIGKDGIDLTISYNPATADQIALEGALNYDTMTLSATSAQKGDYLKFVCKGVLWIVTERKGDWVATV